MKFETIRERAEPEEWVIQWFEGDYMRSKRVKTVAGRGVQPDDWKSYVELKHGPFFNAFKPEVSNDG